MFKSSILFGAVTLLSLFSALVVQPKILARQSSKNSDPLKAYTSCQFEDGLKIVQTDRIVENGKGSRIVKTTGGEKLISRTDSYRVMVAYPDTHFFANIRPEKSNPDYYTQDKGTALESLAYFGSTSNDMQTKEPLKAIYNGFEVYSLIRTAIEPHSTIGMSLIFSDEDKTITTIYFLNQKASKRKFQTIEEWRTLREKFLDRYTKCVKSNLNR